jgi:excisionase family DNA binding protein
MITIPILTKSDDVKVLRYETENPCKAGRMFSEDWLNGKIEWGTPEPNRTPVSLQGDMSTKETHRLAYSLKETANLLGVSYASVNRLVQRGLLKSSRALRTKLISRKEIERFLAETTAD